MRILLVGEYSRLHNSLKEGLVALGHEVKIIGNGDGFKNFPVDFSTKPKWCESKLGNIPRQIIYKLTKFDIVKIEFGIRFYFHLNKFKNYDVIQFINECPINTIPFFERYLLNKIFNTNKRVFLLCCGVDHTIAKYMMAEKPRYSIMTPYFENPKLIEEYRYILNYLKPKKQKIHNLVYKNCAGVIASDIDYYLPLIDNPKFLGLIPNPINLDTIKYTEPEVSDKIVVFHGINRWNYHKKGNAFFEKALDIIQNKYTDKVKIITVENIPYQDYVKLYNEAHILLDQVYGYDQGYNALEAMAKGKVVFTGAEKEFNEYYNLSEQVAINALPDVNQIVDELSFLIENPTEILEIGKRARAFIKEEHDYIKIAGKYLEVWKNN